MIFIIEDTQVFLKLPNISKKNKCTNRTVFKVRIEELLELELKKKAVRKNELRKKRAIKITFAHARESYTIIKQSLKFENYTHKNW